MQGTPSTFSLLLESGWKPPAGLRIVSGGEALTPDLAQRRLRVVDVPGNHVEMFREPNVALMAEAFEAAPRGVEAEPAQ